MLKLKSRLEPSFGLRLGGWPQRLLSSPLGSRLARGAVWSLAGSLVSRGLGFLAAILVGRILGKSDYGALGIVQNTIGMFGMLAGFGMGLTANKHVAEFKLTDPDRAGRIIGTAGLLAWLTSCLMAGVLFLVAPWLATHWLAAPDLGPLLRLGCLLLLLGGVNGAQTGALSGFECFREIARINLCSGLLSFPLLLAGAWYGGLAGSVWALITVQFTNCGLSHLAVRTEAAKWRILIRRCPTRADCRLFWSFSLPAVLTGLLNSMTHWGASVLLVNRSEGYADMGVFNAALRVKLLPEMLVGMLMAPMLPILSESFGRGDHRSFEKTLLFHFSLAAGIIIPVALIQAAAPHLTLLAFGPQYQAVPETVQWLMLHAVAYALMLPMGSVLTSMGRMWFSWLVNLAYAAVLALASWHLIPGHGSMGYAAAMAVAYVTANISCVVFLHRALPEVMSYLRWGWISCVVAILFALCVFASRHLPPTWALAVGALAAAGFLAVQVSCRHLFSRQSA